MKANRQNSRELLLLQSLRDGLAQIVIPDLHSEQAIEFAAFAGQVLDRLLIDHKTLASDEDFSRETAEFIAAIDHAIGRTTETPTGAAALREHLTVRLRELSSATMAQPDREIVLRPLWDQAIALELRHRRQIEAFRTATKNAAPPPAAITAPGLTDYIRAHLPDAAATEVTELRILHGGRSKITMFVTLAGHPSIRQAVLRQDAVTNVVDTQQGATCVADEFPVLQKVYAAGLPVPEPLWLEPSATALGRPFMLTAKMPGAAPGGWRGFNAPEHPATLASVQHLATVLGRLHCLDPARFAVPAEVALAPEPRMQREIEYRWTKWQRDTLEPSPLIECAFARLRAECRHGLGGPALVHGDVLPHNLLVENGRVTALLDWEFAHLGDPAEDLAYLQPVIPAVMPWENFMALYVGAGGQPVDARRLAIFGLYGLVRNCSFLASAARLHATGGTDDFGMGAIGYITLPAIEAQIGAMLQAME